MRLFGLNVLLLAGITGVVGTSTACGDVLRQDRSPVTLVVERLEASSGASGTSSTFSGTLQSDVVTNGGTFNDSGRVTLRLIMKDVGTAPTAVNAVTINRYLVTFRRADGRNTPGVDVPYPFDSATTFTVQPGSPAIQTFELVRHAAKEEAPLRALGLNFAVTIATVADVAFYGRDQAGNQLSAQSSIGVIFGDFADPN